MTLSSLLQVNQSTKIDILITAHAETVRYLTQLGVRCYAFGQPVMDTLGEAFEELHFSKSMISAILRDLNKMITKKQLYDKR